MEFDTYRQAYEYWFNHKNHVRDGMVLVISSGGHSVYDRPIKDAERQKVDRSGQINHKLGCISDDLGLRGVFNHADGKYYDSKSEFRKATRRAGCYEMGTDIKEVNYKTPLERGVRGDFNVKPALKQALEKVLGA